VTRATIEEVSRDGWALFLDTVEVKGSNVPGLRQARQARCTLPGGEGMGFPARRARMLGLTFRVRWRLWR
jgi:hypothetical protein